MHLRCTSLLGSGALVGLVHYCSVPPDTRVKFKNDVLNESMNQCIWNTVDKICTWENPGNREWRQNMGRIVYILGKIRPPGEATWKSQKGGRLGLAGRVRSGGSREMTSWAGSSKSWRDGGYQPTQSWCQEAYSFKSRQPGSSQSRGKDRSIST